MELLSRNSVKQDDLRNKDYFCNIKNTKEFQRLKNISFLGAIDYSFDFNHLSHQDRSRFNHCVSVSKLALMLSDYRNYSEDLKKHLVIAALLHDIGHMPLSHSIEPDVKERYGVDHHQIGCSILKGESPLGKELFKILQKYVDVDVVIDLINGDSIIEGSEFFSNAINIDTIDGITRAANYVNLNTHKLTAEDICLNAFCSDNDHSQSYVDKFWALKGQVYSKFILDNKGLLADHLSALYFRNNFDSFDEENFFEDELIWQGRYPDLFSSLRSQDVYNEKNTFAVSYFSRSYTVDPNRTGNDRYMCIKRKDERVFPSRKRSFTNCINVLSIKLKNSPGARSFALTPI